MFFSNSMPIVVQEQIISYLDKNTLLKLSGLNRHLNFLCLQGKYWKSICIQIREIVHHFESCKKLILHYQGYIENFHVHCNEVFDSAYKNKYEALVDVNLRRTLELLPVSLKTLYFPIYLLQDAVLGNTSKHCLCFDSSPRCQGCII